MFLKKFGIPLFDKKFIDSVVDATMSTTNDTSSESHTVKYLSPDIFVNAS
jgi:hypothetical protein